jgi:hypothetical protein
VSLARQPVAILAAALLTVLAAVTPSLAQEPPVRAPDLSVAACGSRLVRADPGQTIGMGIGVVLFEVTLPSTGQWAHGPSGIGPDNPGLRLCHVPSSSYVVISARTRQETERTVNDPAVAPLFDQIVASARTRPSPYATPQPPLRPPSSGDGGLLR